MKSSRFFASARLLAVASVLLSSLSALPAQAQDSSVAAPAVPVKVRVGDASPIAPVSDSKQFKLAISLPLRNEAALDALLADIYDPQSPNFHHYLSPEEFTNRFSPSQADYDAVVQWAQSKGLQVTRTVSNRRLIDVSGSADVIRRAFHVGLNNYRDNLTSAVFHAPDREPTVDSPVALLGVSGLDNALPPRPHLVKGDALISTSGTIVESANAISRITGSGPGNTYLPSDMRKAYYGNGPLTGAGQTVAIFSYDGYIKNDINVFYNSTGMTSSVPVNDVLVNGYDGSCFGFNSNGTINPNICDDGEQILDIVNVIGMAPGLTQVLFYEGDSSTDVLNQMATDNIAKVISSSWGGGDFGTVSDPIFKQFQAQGITYLNATGDSGQFNSSTYYPPSVDANITQVGGTNLVTTGAGGPWASEVGWPDSGGGFISGTAIPTYQKLAGVINSSNKGSTTLRNAPDVAAEGNFDNSTVINGVFKTGYGGTSYATPRWAGLIALANQQAVANGNATLGFVNPAIYNIGVGANFASNFHDITSGNNRPSAGSGTGFNAVAGYDLVTGWGSPIGATLISTLAGASSSPDYSLSASPTNVSVAQGAAGTSTITVTPLGGFSGSVALSASGLPSGVTASFSPASATSTSTLTLTASSTATLGTATVTITGTSGALTHTTTVSLTVTAAPNYTLSASPTSVSVAQSATGTSTITVTPSNGFAGSVALSASGLPSGVTASFSPASATSTSTLTFTASSTATIGTSTVTITGTSGSLTHTTTVSLTVTATSTTPTLTSVTPNSGAQGAAVNVTLAGTNFISGATVAVTGTGVTVSNVSVVSATQITATLTIAAGATTGARSVSVSTSAGTTGAVPFTVNASSSGVPTLTSVSPSSGALGTSVNVTLTGTNFISGSAVRLQGTGLSQTNIVVVSPTQITATYTISSSAALGAHNTWVVTSAGSSNMLPFTVTSTAPNYTLTASPSTLSVARSGTGGSTIAVVPANGFTGSVALSASGLPVGVTASFSPASTTSSSALTFTASSTATLGTATVTITGTSGTLTATTTVALTVTAAPSYTLTASPSSLSVAQGANGGSTITVVPASGFTGSVALSASGLPAGVTASFSPASTTTSSALTLTASSTATLGPATVTITGTSGTLTTTTTVALTVTAAPSYTLTASPSSLSVAQGGGGGSTITVVPANGFTGSVALSASGLPAGVTASFSPASTTSSSTLSFTASSTAALGTTMVTVTGTSGTLTTTTTVALTVTAAPSYALTASPNSLSVAQSGSGGSTITVVPANGFAGSVALSASGLPAGVTASFSPASTTSTSTLTFTASSTATVGSTMVTVTGTSGALTTSTVIALTITSGTVAPVQLIGNPGFESGVATPWNMSAGTLCNASLCSGETANSGTWFARLGGTGTTHTDTVKQRVTIPAGNTVATLKFFMHIDTAETSSRMNDKAVFYLTNSAGAIVATLGTYSNLNAAPGFTPYTFDVSSFIGQTLSLVIVGTENGSLTTSFVVDDVTLTVQ